MVTVISIGTMKGSSGEASLMGMIFIMIVSLFTVSYFISFHGDLAEGLLISIFIEEKLANVEQITRPPE